MSKKDHNLLLNIVLGVFLVFNAAIQARDIIATVTDAATGQPLPGISIQVLETEASAVTDAAGKCFFPSVADGSYTFLSGGTYYVPNIKIVQIGSYICGDANGDTNINIGDAVYLLTHIFKSGPAPSPLQAGDANADNSINIGDAVYLLTHIFKDGPAPKCP